MGVKMIANCRKRLGLVVIGLICCSVGLGAVEKNDVLYASKVKNLFSKMDDKKAVGRLLPTAKVKVVEVRGDKVLLKINGFVQEGASSAVYFAPNRRILNAALGKTSGITPKLGKNVKVKDSSKKWFEAEITLWSDSENLISDVEPLYKSANESYVASCSSCHSLYGSDKFSANQWPSIVSSMAMRSGMDKESVYLLTQYLQKNASDMKDSKSKK